MAKKDQLTPFYLKISRKLKDKIQDQAKIERIPMATLVSEILETGMSVRPKVIQDRIDKMINAARMGGSSEQG
jgi:hypothetical protein